MEEADRQLALDRLNASKSRLLSLVASLTPQQWAFRESPGRWSIAENIEHLVHFESFILEAVRNALDHPPQPEKKPHAASQQPHVLSLGTAESRRLQLTAREAVRPTGKWSSPSSLVEEFVRARSRTLEFAAESRADLRTHFFPHIAFGDLDCYQWLLILALHTERHCLQIEQIQTHPAYPERNPTPETPEQES